MRLLAHVDDATQVELRQILKQVENLLKCSSFQISCRFEACMDKHARALCAKIEACFEMELTRRAASIFPPLATCDIW